MQHTFFFDGNSKKIAWVIQTKNETIEQKREHAEIYLDKINNLQSKYIALHVGLFWGIGRFIIKNEDQISIKIDDQKMFDHLFNKDQPIDEFIKIRSDFILSFINQRKLKVNFEMIEPKNNLSSKLI